MIEHGSWFKWLQNRFRARRFRTIERIISELLEGREEIRILDIGGRGVYWDALPMHLRKRVDITVLNFASELRAFSSSSQDLRINHVVGDACDMPQYGDGAFDLAHSNSVIEHVGSLGNMARFSRELQRVGRIHYVQTPNFWFPIDPHYAVPLIHWLPDQTRLWLHTRITIGYAPKCSFEDALMRIDHTRMIGRRMMATLFPASKLVNERFFGLVKSITAIGECPAAMAQPLSEKRPAEISRPSKKLTPSGAV